MSLKPLPRHKAEQPGTSRLDVLLVQQGLAKSRTQAQALIAAGLVFVNQHPAKSAAMLISETQLQTIRLEGSGCAYVSRGGEKLEKALTAFDLSVTGALCLDVGASTGGFTDCLLQHGAQHVVAVDVGYGQLDWKLRQDERVTVKERCHILRQSREDLSGPFDVLVMDVSFISVVKILPHVASMLHPDSRMVVLLKPQFEYMDFCPEPLRSKRFNGIVKQADARYAVVLGVLQALCEKLPDWQVSQITASPIRGAKGNEECLVLLVPQPDPKASTPWDLNRLQTLLPEWLAAESASSNLPGNEATVR